MLVYTGTSPYTDRLQAMQTEGVAQRCSVKKVFLAILQNSQENTCARVSFFNKVTGGAFNFMKKGDSGTGVSCEFCEISKNTFSYRTPPVVASDVEHPLTTNTMKEYPFPKPFWPVTIFLELFSSSQIFNIVFHVSMVSAIIIPKAAVQRCSVKRVFLRISQNSKENTCISLFLNEVAGLSLQLC